MKIGCNWSIALKFLLEKDAVNVDYIKSGAFGNFNKEFSTMRALRPILVHGLGYFENSGTPSLEMIDLNGANEIINKCGSPHYGFHLAIRNEDMFEGMSEADIYNRMSKNIQIFKKNLSVPLLVENSPDTPIDRKDYDLYPFNEPDQINKLLIDNDVFFLLDITHAKLTAKFRSFDIYDYLDNLALDRVKEIHINGSGYDKNGFPMDTHEAMKEEDYELLKWVLRKAKPDVVTLEFNEVEDENYDEAIIATEIQLNRINKICCNVI